MTSAQLQRYKKILKGQADPKFVQAIRKGILEKRTEEAFKILEHCELCEHRCGVNRLKDEKGFCGVGSVSRVFASYTHWNEEPEIVPSATLFFSGCTMRCEFCQNAPQSFSGGQPWTPEKMAKWINKKAEQGCKNINLVGGEPTPNLPFILQALQNVEVKIPIIWNSNAYYSEKTAEILKDFVDVYLLDFRYFNDDCAQFYSNVKNYVNTVQRNVLLAEKHAELMIRLLVLPNHMECDAKPILSWIKDNLSSFKLNILSQYWPAHNAAKYHDISRRLTITEYNEIMEYARSIGLDV